MEKDFHYYLVYSMARLTQMPDPALIAYSSQFVDDNNEGQFAIDGEHAAFPERLKTSDGYYYPIMTQSLSIKSLDRYLQKDVYMPFHFLPGDDTVELNGAKNKWSTTPNSRNAQQLLQYALSTKDPYRIGIALHTFADTWSHQNFSAFCEPWNRIYPWYDVFKALVPNIGHAEAGHAPDAISETWIDYRFPKEKRTIQNQARAFDAAGAVYNALRNQSPGGPAWSDVSKSYLRIIQTADYDERIKAISDFLASEDQGPIPDYNKDEWIDEALDKGQASGEVAMRPGFEETPWFCFQQAAKRQFAKVAELTSDL